MDVAQSCAISMRAISLTSDRKHTKTTIEHCDDAILGRLDWLSVGSQHWLRVDLTEKGVEHKGEARELASRQTCAPRTNRGRLACRTLTDVSRVAPHDAPSSPRSAHSRCRREEERERATSKNAAARAGKAEIEWECWLHFLMKCQSALDAITDRLKIAAIV